MLRLHLSARSSSEQPEGSASVARSRLAAALSADRRRLAAPEASRLLAQLLSESTPESSHLTTSHHRRRP